MEIIEIEKLSEPTTKYTLTEYDLNTFLEKFKNLIIKNKLLINQANKEDLKYNKKQVKIKEFTDIIDGYKSNEITELEGKSKIVIHKGDPYVSLHVCIQAYTQNTKVMMITQNFMMGVNLIIFELFNKLLKEYNIDNLVNYMNGFSIDSFSGIKKYYDEIVVIGDTTVYQILENTEKNIKYYPYNNIAIYCEDECLEKLEEAIYIYANENQYEIEPIRSKSYEEAIKLINNDKFKSVAVLLTQNEANREKFITGIKSKDIFVNENPFKMEFGKIYNYLK